MHRDFVVVNQQKVNYCIGIHDNYMDMDLKLFLNYLPAVKNTLTKMVSMKSTLYCSLCDAHKQQFFRVENKEIIISEEFCRSTLKEDKDYFMFMHVVYVEFMDELLQYLACFETDAHVFSFPYPSFMEKYRRRIKYVKACLASVDDKDGFHKNCYMICRQFSLTRFSAIFEGDFELFKRVNVSLHSFMRKFRKGEKIQDNFNSKMLKKFGIKGNVYKEIIDQITVPENVDGELLEPFGPHSALTDKKYYFKKNDRVYLYGSESTAKYSYGVDVQNPAQVKKVKKILKKKEAERLKKEKEKLKQTLQNIKNAENGIFVAPVKKKFKLPLKGNVVGESGLVDRLSTHRFKEQLHKGLYPLRGDHKFKNNHWRFKKHVVQYGLLGKGLKKKPKKKKDKKSNKKKGKPRKLEAKKDEKKDEEDKKDKKGDKKKMTEAEKKKAEKKKKAEEEKKKKEEEKKKKEAAAKAKAELEQALKKAYKVDDKIPGKVEHKNYEDVISRPNQHIEWSKPKPTSDKVEGGEPRNEVFDKSEASIKIKDFVHEVEVEGINPLKDLLHVNYRIDITKLIEKRFALGERLNKDVLHQYMLANTEALKQFNEDIEFTKIDDFESINEKLIEVKDLKKVLKELVKTGDEPLKVAEINRQINEKEKDIAENEARRKIVEKKFAIDKKKREQGDSDLNKEKHVDHKHHEDLYFDDSFNGIQHSFKAIFGS